MPLRGPHFLSDLLINWDLTNFQHQASITQSTIAGVFSSVKLHRKRNDPYYFTRPCILVTPDAQSARGNSYHWVLCALFAHPRDERNPPVYVPTMYVVDPQGGYSVSVVKNAQACRDYFEEMIDPPEVTSSQLKELQEVRNQLEIKFFKLLMNGRGRGTPEHEAALNTLQHKINLAMKDLQTQCKISTFPLKPVLGMKLQINGYDCAIFTLYLTKMVATYVEASETPFNPPPWNDLFLSETATARARIAVEKGRERLWDAAMLEAFVPRRGPESKPEYLPENLHEYFSDQLQELESQIPPLKLT